MQIDIAHTNGRPVGYIISAIGKDRQGEIESI